MIKVTASHSNVGWFVNIYRIPMWADILDSVLNNICHYTGHHLCRRTMWWHNVLNYLYDNENEELAVIPVAGYVIKDIWPDFYKEVNDE